MDKVVVVGGIRDLGGRSGGFGDVLEVGRSSGGFSFWLGLSCGGGVIGC